MISLYDLLEASNSQMFGEPAAQLFTGFCLDSRQRQESQLYVALKTDYGDSHQYIEEAIQNGAAGVLSTRPPECDTTGVSVILVRDVETALLAWASYVLKRYKTSVVAVTGAFGKSLAVSAVHAVLSSQFTVHKPDLEYYGRLALPLGLAGLKQTDRFAVIELSPRQIGEMAEMVQTIMPEVGIITYPGGTHAGRYDQSDQLAREQALLLDYLPQDGAAVLNFDTDSVVELHGRAKAKVLTFGMDRFGADLMAYNILVGQTRTGFDLRTQQERFVGRWTPLLGKHQLYSLLAALAVGMHYQVPLEDALRKLTEMHPLPGRMKPLSGLNGSLLIDDTYSATPQSTQAALDWVAAVKEPEQRVIFVMGDMDTQGGASQRGHRAVGQRAADVVDLLVTEGADAAVVGRAALDHGMERRQVSITYSARDSVVAVKGFQLTEKDLIIVKGGMSARMELVVQALLENDEDRRELARQDVSQQMMGFMHHPARPSWIEVDMDALANNVRELKNIVGPQVALMAVVKSDGYGHGAVQVARTALANGAEYLAVSSMGEALDLREAGIVDPIIVLNYTPVYAIRQAVRQNITVTVYDLQLARAYARAAREMNGRLKVHVKVDTGMGRLGVMAEEAVSFFRHIMMLPNLEIEGIFTHFADADEDPDYTAAQTREFRGVLNPLRASGFAFKYIHAANSAGTLLSKDYHFNMVRTGIAMYGLHPSEKVPVPPSFKPVMTWKTVVAQVKTLPPGHPVGYGRTYITRAEETIAILPVGYADGFRRTPRGWIYVLVHGKPVPVIGRVSMEKTAINVSALNSVSIGDEVVLMGRQGDAVITAEDVARFLGTSNYEVVTTILPRVAR